MCGSSWEVFPVVWEFSGSPPRCLGVVGRPAGCPGAVGRTARCTGVIKRLSRISESVWEAFSDVREWSRGPPA